MKPTSQLTSPSPGRTMTATVRPWWTRYQSFVRDIESGLSSDTADELCGCLGLYRAGMNANSPHRLARVAAAFWLVETHFELLDPGASVLEALRQHMDSGCATVESGLLSSPVSEVARELAREPALVEMLPYMLDSHGEGTRLSALRSQLGENHRDSRRRSGSYLTPGDVSDYMARRVLGDLSKSPPRTVIDPACGTGVFLRAVFCRLVTQGLSAEDVVSHLYGIDISPEAADAARIVLLATYLQLRGCTQPDRAWTRLGGQIVVADALSLAGDLADGQTDPMPKWKWPDGWPRAFDLLLGNPPYAACGTDVDMRGLARTFASFRRATPVSNLYQPFVELMWLLVSETGRGCLVVPMSTAYSSVGTTCDLREAMTSASGRWEFSFFDRTPDALFGDDVKQRTAIVLLDRGAPVDVRSGSVIRWTSRTRGSLFERVNQTHLGQVNLTDGIPKVGTQAEWDAYSAIRKLPARLEDEVTVGKWTAATARLSAQAIAVASTAYNWVSVYRSDNWAQGSSHSSSTPLTVLESSSNQIADALYAVLSSKLVYWLWRVDGDCFHVPASFLRTLPALSLLSTEALGELAGLGRILWERISCAPVQSVNRGRTTTTFSPWKEWQTVSRIDEVLLHGLGLAPAFEPELAALVEGNIVVDSSDSTRLGLRIAGANGGANGGN